MVSQSVERRVARKLFLTTHNKGTEFVNDLLLKIQKIKVTSLVLCYTVFSRGQSGGVTALLLRRPKASGTPPGHRDMLYPSLQYRGKDTKKYHLSGNLSPFTISRLSKGKRKIKNTLNAQLL